MSEHAGPDPVARLAEAAVRAEPALAPFLRDPPRASRLSHEQLDPERAFVLEAVHEGYLMHYEEPRLFAGMDPDLRLLAGDALYALGLSSLAERCDVEAVAELADLISLCARVEAEGRRDVLAELWEASAKALAGRGAGARAAVGERLAAAPDSA